MFGVQGTGYRVWFRVKGLGFRDLGEDAGLIEVDRIQHLERGGVISQQDVHSVQADEGEVPQRAEDVGRVRGVSLGVGEALRPRAALRLQHTADV